MNRKSSGISFYEFYLLVTEVLEYLKVPITEPDVWVDYFEMDLTPEEAVVLEGRLILLLNQNGVRPAKQI